MAISFEQVAATADKIRASNANPTCQNVREALGTGSMATISKLLRRYKNEQPTTQAAAAISLPDSLKKSLFDELERYSAERVSVVRDELNEALQTIESIEAESESLEALCAEKSKAIEKGAQVLDELTATNHEQARRIRDLLEERDSLKELSDSLTLSLAESNASLSAVERERAEIRAENKTNLEKIEALSLQNTAQAIETQRLKTINENLESQYSEKSKALKTALEAVEVQSSKFDSEKERASGLDSKNAVLESQLSASKERVAEQKASIEKMEANIQAERAQHREELRELKELKELEKELKELKKTTSN